MFPYWLVIFILSLLALHYRPTPYRDGDNVYRAKLGGIHFLVICMLTLFIGLRFEVGGDWEVYIDTFDRIKRTPWTFIFLQKEIGHFFVNKIISELNLSFSYVNIIYAFIFTLGLVSFSLTQPRPWLVLVAAFPYLITVVSMGYSRQAMAIGFFFLGFVQLRKRKIYKYTLLMALGTTFHITAVVLLPLAAVISNKNKVLNFVIILFGSVFAINFFSASLSHLKFIYVQELITSSDGAFIRVSMNLIPAIIFIIFRNKIVLNQAEKRIWSLFAYLALVMTLIFLLTPFSTVVDRLSLYLLPIQLVVFAHLPDLVGKRNRRNIYLVLFIVLYFCLIQFVWLNFATHAYLWTPYQMELISEHHVSQYNDFSFTD